MDDAKRKLLLPRKNRVEPQASYANEEISCYKVLHSEVRLLKEIRSLTEEALMSKDPLWSRVEAYTELDVDEKGIDNFLRSRFFPESKRRKRGEKFNPSNTESTKLPRGPSQKGSQLSDEQRKVVENARKESTRKCQRQSTEKREFENKLLALLFCCLYGTNDLNKPLVTGIPPLHKVVPSKRNSAVHMRLRKTSGQEAMGSRGRKVSNHREVRIFLRNLMCRQISLQARATRLFITLGSPVADLIPPITIYIARAFLLMYSMTSKLGCTTNPWALHEDGHRNEHWFVHSEGSSLKDLLGKTLDAAVHYFLEWWKRNYSPDNQLNNCKELSRSHPVIKASETVISAMLDVISPQSFGSERFHAMSLHGYCCHVKHYHKNSECNMCCLSERDIANSEESCHQALEALDTCNKILRQCSQDKKAEVLRSTPLSSTSALRIDMYSQVRFHRLQSTSKLVKELKEEEMTHAAEGLKKVSCQEFRDRVKSEAKLEIHRRTLVQEVLHDVGKFWAALYTSNENTLNYLSSLNLQDCASMHGLVVKVVFGGSTACQVFLENWKHIRTMQERLSVWKDKGTHSLEQDVNMGSVEEATKEVVLMKSGVGFGTAEERTEQTKESGDRPEQDLPQPIFWSLENEGGERPDEEEMADQYSEEELDGDQGRAGGVRDSDDDYSDADTPQHGKAHLSLSIDRRRRRMSDISTHNQASSAQAAAVHHRIQGENNQNEESLEENRRPLSENKPRKVVSCPRKTRKVSTMEEELQSGTPSKKQKTSGKIPIIVVDEDEGSDPMSHHASIQRRWK